MKSSGSILRSFTFAAACLVVLIAHARGQSLCVPRFEPAPQMPYPTIANRGTGDTIFASVLWDPDGGGGYQRERLVVGGAFTVAGGFTANRVAMWDGTTWQVVGPQGFNGTVNALVVLNGTLYAGGAFTASGSTTCNRVARYNPATNAWLPVGNGFDGEVDALEAHEGLLYAGGHFNNSGVTQTRHIAQFNGSTWVQVDGGTNGNVLALKSFLGRLYVGGQFTQVNSVNRNGIAFWTSAGSWSSMGTGISPSNNSVRAFAIQGADLLIGGQFAWIGSSVTVSNNLARYTPNATAGTFTGITDFYLQGFQVSAILPVGNEIYVGGTDATWTMLRFNGSAWSRDAYSNVPGVGQSVFTLASYDGEIHAGGYFGFFNGGLSANNITRRHDGNWEPLHPRLNGSVYSFANFNGLSVGGTFEQSMPDFSPTMGLLTYNASTETFGSLGVLNNTVKSLFVSSNGISGFPRLYASGMLFSAGTSAPSINNIASWIGPIGTGGAPANWTGTVNGVTHTSLGLARLNASTGYGTSGGVFGTPILHIAGMFTHANGTPCANVAKLVSGAWQPLGSGLTLTAPSIPEVNALVVYNGQLYAGGGFDNAGGVATASIAAWNGTTWSSLAGNGARNGTSPGTVYALANYNSLLFVAGRFNSTSGVPSGGISSWNGTSWTPRSAGILNTDEIVYAFGQMNGDLFAATTRIENARPVGRVYKWDGTRWNVGAGTADGYIFALFPSNGKLQVGGSFLHAGHADSRFWAQISCTCPADLDDGSGTGTPDAGVTIDDFLYFLGLYEVGNLGADLDDGSGTGYTDGGVTIDDILYFLARYELGC